MRYLPHSFWKITTLEDLNLKSLSLHEFPDKIGYLNNLRRLNIPTISSITIFNSSINL
jgi:hypothetical protein